MIELPIPFPSCPAFGGERLDTLFITTIANAVGLAETPYQPLRGRPSTSMSTPPIPPSATPRHPEERSDVAIHRHELSAPLNRGIEDAVIVEVPDATWDGWAWSDFCLIRSQVPR